MRNVAFFAINECELNFLRNLLLRYERNVFSLGRQENKKKKECESFINILKGKKHRQGFISLDEVELLSHAKRIFYHMKRFV